MDGRLAAAKALAAVIGVASLSMVLSACGSMSMSPAAPATVADGVYVGPNGMTCGSWLKNTLRRRWSASIQSWPSASAPGGVPW